MTDALPPQTHALPIRQREEQGRALRERCKRGAHGDWTTPGRDPPHRDPIGILIEQGKTRLTELLPLRYARMSASPFAFLRGSAAVMAADLAHTPSTGLLVQAAGDCHCLNFGGFATPERRLSFDTNDFDETAIAPWEWDVKRLATSFAVAGLAEKFDRATRLDLAETVARAYRETMAAIATAPILETWYRVLTLDGGKVAESIGLDPTLVDKADRELKHRPMLIDITHSGGAEPKLQDKLPDLFHPKPADWPDFLHGVEAMLDQYRQSLIPERRALIERYRLADAAYKVVGVGSVGTLCGVALMVSGNGETLQLQFKEADASVLEAFNAPSPYANHGERVVRGQRLLQGASDILLGYGVGPRGKDFYVRQLRDAKVKPVLENLPVRNFRRYARTCGEVLARGHARSADAVVLSAYLGTGPSFDQAIGQFALAYAKQTESDHAALKDAIKTGRVPSNPQDS